MTGGGHFGVLRLKNATGSQGSHDLPDTVDSDIGSTICFEIIEDYFHVLANQSSAEIAGIEYTSYYDFFRFSVDRPSCVEIERPRKCDLFRKQYSEAVLDDRGTFLKIFKDELPGELKILESRRKVNWGTRTCYTNTIVFDADRDEDSDDD